MSMHRCHGALGLALIAPLCLAWTGGGEARGTWTEGEGKTILAERPLGGDAVVQLAPDGEVQVVATIDLPGGVGDAVLGMHLGSRIWQLGPVPLDDADVDLRYTEYGEDGEVLFRGDAEPEGTVRIYGDLAGGLVIELEADLFERDDARIWRRLHAARFVVRPTGRDEGLRDGPGDDGVNVDGVVVGGCDDGWDDDPDESWSSDSSSGCEGDGLDGGDSGGCEGDGLDGGDSSGCAGDGLDSGGSSGCDGGGCSGDALAAGSGRPRSRWALRLLNWAPWVLMCLAIRLLRRRRA